MSWHLRTPLSREVVLSSGSALVILGGETLGGKTVADVTRVDTSTGRITSLGTLPSATHDAGGAWIAGRALVFGGGNVTSTATVQGIGSIVGRMPNARSDLATASVDGHVVVVGGYDGARLLPQVLETSNGRTFRVRARLATPARYAAVASQGHTIYVFGGTDGVRDTSVIQASSAGGGTSRIVAHLPTPLSHSLAVTVGAQIFVFGGRVDGKASALVLAFDPSTDRTVVVGSLPDPISDAAAAMVGGRVYVVGGENTQPVARVIGCDVAS